MFVGFYCDVISEKTSILALLIVKESLPDLWGTSFDSSLIVAIVELNVLSSTVSSAITSFATSFTMAGLTALTTSTVTANSY